MVIDPSGITAAWLSEHLGGVVQGFTCEAVGTGQVGRCYRLTLQHNSPNLPASVVVKFSSDNETSRASGQAMKTYLTEVNFYRHIEPRLNIAVPHCYFADVDPDGLYHVLLMEDLSPAAQGDQIAGCSVAVCREAVQQLVGLHAPTWNDRSDEQWLGRVQDGPFADMKTLYNNTMPGFVERYRHRMLPEHIAFIESIGAAQQCPMFDYEVSPCSLEHYDYRLDNVLIDESSGIKVTAVDWQSVRVGKPLNDVAYFMGSALTTEHRRTAELDILHDYYDGLCSAGVTGFTWEECLDHYRRGIFAGFAVAVVAPVLVERTDRGDEMFTTMATRYAAMALDHEAQRYLS